MKYNYWKDSGLQADVSFLSPEIYFLRARDSFRKCLTDISLMQFWWRNKHFNSSRWSSPLITEMQLLSSHKHLNPVYSSKFSISDIPWIYIFDLNVMKNFPKKICCYPTMKCRYRTVLNLGIMYSSFFLQWSLSISAEILLGSNFFLLNTGQSSYLFFSFLLTSL